MLSKILRSTLTLLLAAILTAVPVLSQEGSDKKTRLHRHVNLKRQPSVNALRVLDFPQMLMSYYSKLGFSVKYSNIESLPGGTPACHVSGLSG